VCAACFFFFVVHKVTVLVKKFESMYVLGFVVSHHWFDGGFETNFHT
jgi:deoxycytidine triphosphate deaminase